jgi:bacteriocin-like protein
MNKKSRSEVNDSIKHTSEKLPAEFLELSDEDLQQVVGGKNFFDALNEGIEIKRKAINNTVKGIFQRNVKGKDVRNLLIPTHWHVIGRFF